MRKTTATKKTRKVATKTPKTATTKMPKAAKPVKAAKIKAVCPHFDNCEAPLCPLESQSIRNGIWYPNEEVCRKVGVPIWVKRQRKLVKKGVATDGFFTVAMLEACTRMQKGVQGLDPDEPLKESKVREQKWIEVRKPSQKKVGVE